MGLGRGLWASRVGSGGALAREEELIAVMLQLALAFLSAAHAPASLNPFPISGYVATRSIWIYSFCTEFASRGLVTDLKADLRDSRRLGG